nr:MAG TPA_asm: hypothetical protein [Caudoviricetes sp.]
MKKYTTRQLKELVKIGAAIDVTDAISTTAIPEWYDKIGYSRGINGINGLLMRGKSGKLYAITSRSTAISIFI